MALALLQTSSDPPALAGIADRAHEEFEGEPILDDEILGPSSHRTLRHTVVIHAGENDHRGGRGLPVATFEGPVPFAVGQMQVEEYDINAACGEALQAIL